MKIQEQIQILEDNLNEYGQCNITIEEYNFLQDEIYSSGCLAGIELGKKEQKEEMMPLLKAIKFVLDDYATRLADYSKAIEEQLKEQK